MKDILEKIDFIKKGITNIETIMALEWTMINSEYPLVYTVPLRDGEILLPEKDFINTDRMEVIIERAGNINYSKEFETLAVLLCEKAMGSSEREKNLLGAALLRYIAPIGTTYRFDKGYPDAVKELFIEKVLEAEAKDREKRQNKDDIVITRADIEQELISIESGAQDIQRVRAFELRFRIQEIFSLPIDTKNAPFNLYPYLVRPDSKPAQIDENIDQSEEESLPAPKKWLTHQQLIVLLDKVGFFDIEAVKNMPPLKKAELVGNILRYDIPNTRTYTFNLGKGINDVQQKDFVSSPTNIRRVNNFLKNIDF